MKARTRRRLAFLGGFAVYFALLWTFWDTTLVYPLKIFVVLLHELSHALAVLATGGVVDHIALDPAEGGETWAAGGSRVLALSAGYLGSLLWGSLLVMAAHTKHIRPGHVTGVAGVLVLALTAVGVRSEFGILFGLLFGAGLIVAALQLPPLWNRRLVLVLGMTSCLYAVLDIKSDVLDRPWLESDAAMLAEVTGLPTLFWGGLWIVVALAACALLFRWAWRKA